LRILYCSQDYCPHDYRFLKALAETDYEVYWFRLEDRQRALEVRDLPEKIRVVAWREKNTPVHWWQYPYLRKRFQAIVRTLKPDLVHAGPIQPVSILPAMIDYHPLVSMSWGFDMLQDADRNGLWRWVTNYVLERTDWLFCDCQTVKEKAIRSGFQSEKIVVFPWGVDLALFKPADKPRESQHGLTFLSTRSWEPRYGMDVVLQGFAAAVQKKKDMKLIMLSSGSLADWVRAFIQDHQLEQHIELRGQINNDELNSIYHQADVYLSASHVDGSSVALMEALACGTPALVSDIPSNLEWVQDGEQGWIFQDGNTDDLTRKILEIGEHHSDLIRMSHNARKRAEEKADWNKNKAIMASAYQMILEG
jgi:glycosyltransferase involved in cell wall biosynthesis